MEAEDDDERMVREQRGRIAKEKGGKGDTLCTHVKETLHIAYMLGTGAFPKLGGSLAKLRVHGVDKRQYNAWWIGVRAFVTKCQKR